MGRGLGLKFRKLNKGKDARLFSLANLEKQKANNKIMQTLLTEDGHLVDTQEEILKETANFYQRLYKSETTDTGTRLFTK